MHIKVKCPSCSRTVKAAAKYAGRVVKCPGCQTPMKIPVPEAVAVESSPAPEQKPASTPPKEPEPNRSAKPASPAPEQVVLNSRPSMFRNRPLLFVLLVLMALIGVFVSVVAKIEEGRLVGLTIAGVTLFTLVVWYLQCLTTRLQITTKRSIVRRGILAKNTREVRHSDVRVLEVTQGLLQRLFDVGGVAVGSAGHGGVEIVVNGLAHPVRIKETIDKYRP